MTDNEQLQCAADVRREAMEEPSDEERIRVLEEQEKTAGEGMAVLAGEIGESRERIRTLESLLVRWCHAEGGAEQEKLFEETDAALEDEERWPNGVVGMPVQEIAVETVKAIKARGCGRCGDSRKREGELCKNPSCPDSKCPECGGSGLIHHLFCTTFGVETTTLCGPCPSCWLPCPACGVYTRTPHSIYDDRTPSCGGD